MPPDQAKLDALFKAAVAIESDEQQMAFVQQQCGDDVGLREQLLQRLNSARQEVHEPEQPLTVLDATQLPDGQQAVSLDAGQATAFGEEEAVALGNAGQSVLKMLGQTIDVPRVALRESDAEGGEPIAQTRSSELPRSTPASGQRANRPRSAAPGPRRKSAS